ncbi:MAG: ATP-binding protein [Desulfuromonadaceae bacterium]|nr:ATP-binding protein [Desulfuromonadaceae bacterium]
MPRLSTLYRMVRPSGVYGYIVGLSLVAGATLVCEVLRHFLLPINLLMIYLLTVVLVALNTGLKPAIAAVALAGFIYNYLYTPPRFVFDFFDKEYLVTFFGLFITGAVISSLVNKASERAEILRVREAETACLYHLSRELAVAADAASILRTVVDNVEESIQAQIALFLPNGEQLEMVAASRELTIDLQELDLPVWAFHHSLVAGHGTGLHETAKLVYFPLKTLSKNIGVMAINLAEDSDFSFDQMFRLLEAFAAQTAMALERVNLSHQAEQAKISLAQQKLERALLNSVSHDLRSPLATITGVLTSILEQGDNLTEQVRRELLENAREEAARLNRFVGNLLDISRLEARGAILKKEPCDVQDLIGCALAATERQMQGRTVGVNLVKDLPMVAMDMVLMNHVLINLLDNALKYSLPDGVVDISARCNDEKLILQVADTGPGVPVDELKRIFEKFYRIPVPESIKGTGLGLSICNGIVEAHGGKIWADNRPGGGFVVTLEMPLQAASQEKETPHG